MAAGPYTILHELVNTSDEDLLAKVAYALEAPGLDLPCISFHDYQYLYDCPRNPQHLRSVLYTLVKKYEHFVGMTMEDVRAAYTAYVQPGKPWRTQRQDRWDETHGKVALDKR